MVVAVSANNYFVNNHNPLYCMQKYDQDSLINQLLNNKGVRMTTRKQQFDFRQVQFSQHITISNIR
jgi:hypothetical protein